ncbi:MAG: D-alanyl-D-alanine carboxypeptidase [Lachnospiraceae bacterium]|jgi:D-alanyl-D-alanine carboxypeptidase (penicillin-binding protein 5/6)|nr:D-alanyl-D-alanine carboxypeptidase [Lachnospiraceae bacterium]
MKHLRKKLIGCCIGLFSICLLSGCGSSSPMFFPYESNFTPTLYQPTGTAAPDILPLMGNDLCVISEKDTGSLTLSEELDAGAVLAVQNDNNTLLYQEHVFERLYPASLTKLMTAYTVYALEDNLEREYTIPAEATELPDIYAKKCGLMAGDVITIHELLYAALIPSANDAAKALAMAVCGTEEEFVAQMNELAKELGATQSHFSNSHGLHSDDHYTTLYDMYLIFHELLENEDFRAIVQNKQYEMHYQNSAGSAMTKTVTSTNQYLTGGVATPSFFSVLGGKSGTTNQAGSCLMVYCEDLEKNGYILAVLKAENPQALYEDLGVLFQAILPPAP